MTDEIVVLKIRRFKISLWIDIALTNGVLGLSYFRPYKNYTSADYYIGLHFLILDLFFTVENNSGQ